jgi:hypothetical protein
MNKSCSTCKYSIRYLDGKNNTLYYECRYNPPSVYGFPVNGKEYLIDVHNSFPHLQESDWCFKYKKNLPESNTEIQRFHTGYLP